MLVGLQGLEVLLCFEVLVSFCLQRSGLLQGGGLCGLSARHAVCETEVKRRGGSAQCIQAAASAALPIRRVHQGTVSAGCAVQQAEEFLSLRLPVLQAA